MDDLAYPSPAYEPAVALLKMCWQAIDPDYKSQYRMTIWDQVEAKMRSVANTVSSLDGWVQGFLTLRHTAVRSPASLAGMLSTADHRAVLKLYRERAGVVVAYARAELEAERAAREEVT